jgi:hypothetical protein
MEGDGRDFTRAPTVLNVRIALELQFGGFWMVGRTGCWYARKIRNGVDRMSLHREANAERLVFAHRPHDLRVITRFDLKAFNAGVGDLDALDLLLQSGAKSTSSISSRPPFDKVAISRIPDDGRAGMAGCRAIGEARPPEQMQTLPRLQQPSKRPGPADLGEASSSCVTDWR